jgi:hypothetical protein
MDYEIYPLAITQVEWSIFIDTCQRVLGISPTRGIDACHLDLKDPASYLACLNMENKPLDALRARGSWFQHFSITFVMVLDVEGVLQLANTPLHFYWKHGKRRELLTVVSGNMDEWYRAIVDGTGTYELRLIMNLVLARLEQAGFREIFSSFQKQTLTDGTFILKS